MRGLQVFCAVTAAMVIVGVALQSSIAAWRTKTPGSRGWLETVFPGRTTDDPIGALETEPYEYSEDKAIDLVEALATEFGEDFEFDLEDLEEDLPLVEDRRLQGGPEMIEIGNNGKPAKNFPLKKCEGDCDRNGECAGSLQCFQRKGNEEVPGCSIGPRTRPGIDFCYDPKASGSTPGDSPTKPPVPSPTPAPGGSGGGFRLKLYWQKGYYWQEERVEKKWCLQCCGGSCGNGDCIKLRSCGGGNTKWKFQEVANKKYQIKVSNKDLCMTLEGRRRIRLRKCEAGDKKQHWWASRGSFGGVRFEIHALTRDGCITQHHHPRNGEEILVDTDCRLARKWDTSFWNRY